MFWPHAMPCCKACLRRRPLKVRAFSKVALQIVSRCATSQSSGACGICDPSVRDGDVRELACPAEALGPPSHHGSELAVFLACPAEARSQMQASEGWRPQPSRL